MLTSRDRILTTHCGSLPRPPQLSELLRLRGEVGLLRKENEELARQRAQQPAERPGPSAEEELKLEARRA